MPYLADRVILNFAEFEDAPPPMMTRDEIRSAMSAAESLVKKSNKLDNEALLDLSSDEVVACCMMLLVLAADQGAPQRGYQPRGPSGEYVRPKFNGYN
jgi:hypothetical protein